MHNAVEKNEINYKKFHKSELNLCKNKEIKYKPRMVPNIYTHRSSRAGKLKQCHGTREN